MTGKWRPSENERSTIDQGVMKSPIRSSEWMQLSGPRADRWAPFSWFGLPEFLPSGSDAQHGDRPRDWRARRCNLVARDADAELSSGCRDFAPGMDAELRKDAPDMVIDRFRGKKKMIGDFGILAAGGQQRQNLKLARR